MQRVKFRLYSGQVTSSMHLGLDFDPIGEKLSTIKVHSTVRSLELDFDPRGAIYHHTSPGCNMTLTAHNLAAVCVKFQLHILTQFMTVHCRC